MLEIILFFLVLVLAGAVFFLYLRLKNTEEEFEQLKFSKASQSVKYGKMTEQWIPLMDSFPYDPANFRFLGTPIDGIAFNDEKIIFLEFKTSNSQLNKKQKHIKELVKNSKVEWKEIRIS